VRDAHPPIVDKLVNEEKAPAADAAVVAPPFDLVELAIDGPVDEDEDVGEESIGPLEHIPFSYESGGI
jgi:hypothetical protein